MINIPSVLRDSSEARRRLGSLAQAARIDRFTEDEGAARGARRARLVNRRRTRGQRSTPTARSTSAR